MASQPNSGRKRYRSSSEDGIGRPSDEDDTGRSSQEDNMGHWSGEDDIRPPTPKRLKAPGDRRSNTSLKRRQHVDEERLPQPARKRRREAAWTLHLPALDWNFHGSSPPEFQGRTQDDDVDTSSALPSLPARPSAAASAPNSSPATQRNDGDDVLTVPADVQSGGPRIDDSFPGPSEPVEDSPIDPASRRVIRWYTGERMHPLRSPPVEYLFGASSHCENALRISRPARIPGRLMLGQDEVPGDPEMNSDDMMTLSAFPALGNPLLGSAQLEDRGYVQQFPVGLVACMVLFGPTPVIGHVTPTPEAQEAGLPHRASPLTEYRTDIACSARRDGGRKFAHSRIPYSDVSQHVESDTNDRSAGALSPIWNHHAQAAFPILEDTPSAGGATLFPVLSSVPKPTMQTLQAIPNPYEDLDGIHGAGTLPANDLPAESAFPDSLAAVRLVKPAPPPRIIGFTHAHNRRRKTLEMKKLHAGIREMMREELGFGSKKDNTLPHPPASIDDIASFLRGGNGPKADYLQLDFVTTRDGIKSHWNRAAAKGFAQRFLFRVHNAYFHQDAFAQRDLTVSNIGEIFLKKIRYIMRLYRARYFPLPRNIAKIGKEIARRISRRLSLYRLRRRVCREDARDLQRVFSFVDDEIISEDETDAERSRPGMKVFRRVEKGWVNPVLTRILHDLVDVHLHRLNIFGEFGAGTQFRQRINHPPKRVEWTGVVVGLPRNFYNPTWLQKLSREEFDELNCQPAVNLEAFVAQLRRPQREGSPLIIL
ncbi:hypothetical protein AURDEDRAFT_130399 [Auricularia subglabra TFB-10046 SS5]|nr:hypothetical protein AURDEDRAFT_130399 [Auricularia subglabra TFB-10046 SS5]